MRSLVTPVGVPGLIPKEISFLGNQGACYGDWEFCLVDVAPHRQQPATEPHTTLSWNSRSLRVAVPWTAAPKSYSISCINFEEFPVRGALGRRGRFCEGRLNRAHQDWLTRVGLASTADCQRRGGLCRKYFLHFHASLHEILIRMIMSCLKQQ